MNSILKHFLSLTQKILLSTCLLILAFLFVACDDTGATTTTNSQVATTLLSQAAPYARRVKKQVPLLKIFRLVNR